MVVFAYATIKFLISIVISGHFLSVFHIKCWYFISNWNYKNSPCDSFMYFEDPGDVRIPRIVFFQYSVWSSIRNVLLDTPNNPSKISSFKPNLPFIFYCCQRNYRNQTVFYSQVLFFFISKLKKYDLLASSRISFYNLLKKLFYLGMLEKIKWLLIGIFYLMFYLNFLWWVWHWVCFWGLWKLLLIWGIHAYKMKINWQIITEKIKIK
jgi:hypothetical protein